MSVDCMANPRRPVSAEIRQYDNRGRGGVIGTGPQTCSNPSYGKMKEEAEKAGLVKKEEDILTYIMYPAIAPAFLKGERSLKGSPGNSSLPASKSAGGFRTRWKSRWTEKSSRSESYRSAAAV